MKMKMKGFEKGIELTSMAGADARIDSRGCQKKSVKHNLKLKNNYLRLIQRKKTIHYIKS